VEYRGKFESSRCEVEVYWVVVKVLMGDLGMNPSPLLVSMSNCVRSWSRCLASARK
jgi:hypothetical protein